MNLAILWMNFANIRPSQRSQSQKATCCKNPIKIGKSIERERRLAERLRLERWGGGSDCSRGQVSFWKVEKVLKLDCGDGHATL